MPPKPGKIYLHREVKGKWGRDKGRKKQLMAAWDKGWLTEKKLAKMREYFLAEKGEINTFYIKVMVDVKEYQAVRKNEGAKDFPPQSSRVLLFPCRGSGMAKGLGL